MNGDVPQWITLLNSDILWIKMKKGGFLVESGSDEQLQGGSHV